MAILIGGGGGGTDSDAIHDNVAGEINAIAEKAAPIAADLIVIEDSADSNNKKKVQAGNLPGGGDSTHTDTYANIPAASNAGDLFLPSDGVALYRDTGAAWVPWGPQFPLAAPPTAGWSWDNQSTSTLAASNGGINITNLTLSAAGELNAYVRSIPSVPYTVIMHVVSNCPLTSSNIEGIGVCWRESGTGKLYNLSWAGGGTLYVGHWTDSTTFSAYPANMAWNIYLPWFRLEDNNTNRIASISGDGQNWIPIHTEARANFLTADQIGICLWTNDTVAGPGASETLISWEES